MHEREWAGGGDWLIPPASTGGCSRYRALVRLASMPSQGLLAGHGGRFTSTSYCTAVAKTRSPYLIRFSTLVIAEWLPCEKVLWNKLRPGKVTIWDVDRRASCEVSP